MQIDLVSGAFRQIHGRVKALWATFADYEVPKIPRDRDGLVDAVQKHFGYTREKAQEEVDRRFPG